MVVFNEEQHKYTNQNKQQYISATTIIHEYSKPFNALFMSHYCALKELDRDFVYNKGRYFQKEGKPIEYLLEIIPDYVDRDILDLKARLLVAQWDETNRLSRVKGTRIHLEKENASLGKEKEDFAGMKYQVNQKTPFKFEDFNGVSYYELLKDGYHSELLLWNHELGIAGTADIVVIETDMFGDKWVSIGDFKGFSLDTPIPSKTGWINMGDIKIGDEIFDGNGKITKVKNVSEIHHNPCFKIVFDTNDELICDHEHKWEITNRKSNGKTLFDTVMTTEEIYNSYNNDCMKKPQIKCTNIDLPDVDLPLDPYLLGLWIADGNRTCSSITCLNQKTWKEIERRGFEISIDHNRNSEKGAESRTVLGIRKILKDLHLIGNKHIPAIYYRASHKQRLDLLRGLMDGDGHFHKKRKRCVMLTTKKWQADLTMELTSSLGMKPTIFNGKTSGFGKTNIPTWHVCFTPTENPFLTRNEDYCEIVKNKRTHIGLHRSIKSIERIDTVPTKCLEVESDLHTYLVGKSFIKTHNTNKEIKMDSKYKMLYPLNKYGDVNYNHYTLQLSLYSYLLELMGFRVKHLRLIWINEVGDEIPFILNYKKQDVINMIKHYNQNK